MDETCLPKCLLVCRPQAGKGSAGGQKRHWNDVVCGKCGLLPGWRDLAHERGAWRALVKEATRDLARSLEESEIRKKDERKLRRGGQSSRNLVHLP